MQPNKILAGNYVLVVDDEPDVLETLIEFLDMCVIDSASSFEEAKMLLEKNKYDITVLDIMGVDGYDLLAIAKERKIPALMLTAHALSSENLTRSAKEGAAYYAPKDEIAQIATFLADVLQAKRESKNPWERMIDRLGKFYDQKFHGTNWRDQQDEYLKKQFSHWF